MKKIILIMFFVFYGLNVFAENVTEKIDNDIEVHNIISFSYLFYQMNQNPSYIESIHVLNTPEKLEKNYTYKIERKNLEGICEKSIEVWLKNLNYAQTYNQYPDADFVNGILFNSKNNQTYKLFFDTNFLTMNFENKNYYIKNSSNFKKIFFDNCLN